MTANQRSEPSGLQPIGRHLPSTAKMEARLDSTESESKPRLSDSETKPPTRAVSARTGKQLSEIGYARPTNLAETTALLARAAPGLVDKALEAWLPRSVRQRGSWEGVSGEYGWRPTHYSFDHERGPEIGESDGRESLRVLEWLNAEAEPQDCAGVLGRLKVLTRERNLSQEDLSIQIAVYAEELSQFPIDVVRDACAYWARNEKWFPSWTELRAECEERVSKRRAFLMGLRRYFASAAACDPPKPNGRVPAEVLP